MRLIQFDGDTSAGMGASSALALATDKVVTLDATHSKGGAFHAGDSGVRTDTEDSATATTIAVDDGAEKFRAGDYIFLIHQPLMQ